MSKSSGLISQFGAELLGRVFAALSGALMLIILARLLSPGEYGLLYLAISVFGVMKLFTKLGIGKSAARYISEYKEKDPSQIPHIIRISMKYNIITISIVSIVVLIFHEHIAEFLGEIGLAPFLLLGVLYLIFITLSTYTRFILQGYEKIQFAALIQGINQGSTIIFAVGFVLLGFGGLGALGGYIVSSALATVTGLIIMYFKLYKPIEESKMIEKGLKRRIGEYAIPLTATNTATSLDRQLDTILVGFFLTPVSVSYYVIGKQIVTFVKTPATALGFTLSPTFGAKKADGDIERASRIYETAFVNSLLLYIPAGAGLVLISSPLINYVFGSDFRGAIPVVQVLSLYIILLSITAISNNGLDFLGRARARAIVMTITSTLNVLLNILFIPVFGVVGAAIATVITYSIYTSLVLYIINQEFDIRVKYLVVKTIHILAITLIMSLVVFSLLNYVHDLISMFVAVFAGILVWVCLSTLTGLMNINKIMPKRVI